MDDYVINGAPETGLPGASKSETLPCAAKCAGMGCNAQNGAR